MVLHACFYQLCVILRQNYLNLIPQFLQTLLLGLKYEDFSWDFGKPPTVSDDPECLPCLFIQVRKLTLAYVHLLCLHCKITLLSIYGHDGDSSSEKNIYILQP